LQLKENYFRLCESRKRNMTIVFRRLTVINKSFFRLRDQLSAIHNHFLTQYLFSFKKKTGSKFLQRGI